MFSSVDIQPERAQSSQGLWLPLLFYYQTARQIAEGLPLAIPGGTVGFSSPRGAGSIPHTMAKATGSEHAGPHGASYPYRRGQAI